MKWTSSILSRHFFGPETYVINFPTRQELVQFVDIYSRGRTDLGQPFCSVEWVVQELRLETP